MIINRAHRCFITGNPSFAWIKRKLHRHPAPSVVEIALSYYFYIRDLYQDQWGAVQASTQYQGSGSSHDLASLLVTEVIQCSLHVANLPVFLLVLDAQSAFDRCLRQILVCELYRAGMQEIG